MGEWDRSHSAETYAAAVRGLQQKANILVQNMVNVSAKALYDVGLKIIMDAYAIAPKDTGNLRSAAYCYMKINGVTVAEFWPDTGQASSPPGQIPLDAGSIEVVVGFDDKIAKYAFVQHEHIEFQHQEGQAKFLEIALDRHLPELYNSIKVAVKGVLDEW